MAGLDGIFKAIEDKRLRNLTDEEKLRVLHYFGPGNLAGILYRHPDLASLYCKDLMNRAVKFAKSTRRRRRPA